MNIDKRWLILFLLFFARISLGFQFQTMGSVSSQIIDELSFNYTQIGSLIGLFMVPGLFLAIPAGLTGNFLSDKSIIGLGLISLSLGGGIASLSETYELFFSGRLICGVGFVFSTIFFAKVTTDWFEGKELATAMSILVMSWPFGIAMGQIGHGWLATNFDWRWAFIIASSYCAISALLIMILFHSPPHIKSEKVSFGIRLTGNELLLTLVASSAWGLFNAGYVVYLSFGPSILIAQGMNTVSALGVISIASWIMIFSGALCGYIADRSGRPDLIVFICLTFSMLSLLSLCFTTANLMSVLIFGLIGMAPAGLIMALAAKAMRPENRALGMGIFFMGQFFLQGPAPGIAGWIYDNTLSPTFPMLFGIFLFLSTAITTLVFSLLRKRIPLR